MYIKKIKSSRDIVAICDENLIGKFFEEGDFQLELKEVFYKGDNVSKEDAKKIIKDMKKEDATFNIVGENSIQTALESGVISEKDIRKIQNIPYSMILL